MGSCPRCAGRVLSGRKMPSPDPRFATQLQHQNSSVEQAFTLPRSVILRGYARAGLFLLLYYAFVLLFRPSRPLSDVLTSLGLTLIFALGVSWWGSQYKYVRLSPSGLRGRPSKSFKMQVIGWSEPLWTETTSQPFLKGHTFISISTGSSIFIPLPILRSPAFQQALEQQAPPEHVLRNTKF